MSILIKGVDMPTSCSECAFCGYYGNKTHLCDINQQEIDYEAMLENRRDDCPLVPVPEHGQMSNADRIRAMTDEELAEWLDNIDTAYEPETVVSRHGWLDWLKSPVEVDNG